MDGEEGVVREAAVAVLARTMEEVVVLAGIMAGEAPATTEEVAAPHGSGNLNKRARVRRLLLKLPTPGSQLTTRNGRKLRGALERSKVMEMAGFRVVTLITLKKVKLNKLLMTILRILPTLASIGSHARIVAWSII